MTQPESNDPDIVRLQMVRDIRSSVFAALNDGMPSVEVLGRLLVMLDENKFTLSEFLATIDLLAAPRHGFVPMKPDPALAELRMKARLAWNGWPDNEQTRATLTAHEAKDQLSAAAWDRVIAAVRTVEGE